MLRTNHLPRDAIEVKLAGASGPKQIPVYYRLSPAPLSFFLRRPHVDWGDRQNNIATGLADPLAPSHSLADPSNDCAVRPVPQHLAPQVVFNLTEACH